MSGSTAPMNSGCASMPCSIIIETPFRLPPFGGTRVAARIDTVLATAPERLEKFLLRLRTSDERLAAQRRPALGPVPGDANPPTRRRPPEGGHRNVARLRALADGRHFTADGLRRAFAAGLRDAERLK